MTENTLQKATEMLPQGINGLTIVVLAIIGLCAYAGYRQGFIRVVYSLVSWILVMAAVTWATPYVTDYLENQTKLRSTIEEKCVAYMEKTAQEKAQEVVEDEEKEQENSLQQYGIFLPDNVMKSITDTTVATAGDLMAQSGIYGAVAASVAHFIIEGIAFFITLAFVSLCCRSLLRLLNIVSHLPVIHGLNKTLGIGAGVIKGLVIVWIAFYLITLFCTSELGSTLMSYIKESPILMYLYEHNVIMNTVMMILAK